MYVSDNNGKSFESYNPYDMILTRNAEFPTDFFVDEINYEDETVTLRWVIQKGEEKELHFLTAVYDAEMNFIKEYYRFEPFYRMLDVIQGEQLFVFTDSDRRYLTEGEIGDLIVACESWREGSAKKVLSYAINEIYLRKGYDFEGTEYEEYYKGYRNGMECEINGEYSMDIKDIADRFNVYEQHNVDLLAEYRNKL